MKKNQPAISIDTIDTIDIPDEYLCPITLEIMEDPVSAADGHTYERTAINQWFIKGRLTSPKTGEVLKHSELTPNFPMRSIIASFKENIPHLQQRRINERRDRQLGEDFMMAVKLREEEIQYQLDIKKNSVNELEKNQRQLDRHIESKSVVLVTACTQLNDDEINSNKIAIEQREKTSLQALASNCTLFQSQSPPKDTQRQQATLPVFLIESLSEGYIKSELLYKEIRFSYFSRLNFVTETEISQEGHDFFNTLIQNLKNSEVADLISCYSKLPTTYTWIIQTKYSTDSEDLHIFINENNIIEKINSKLGARGLLNIVLLGKEIKINYAKKPNIITEIEAGNKSTAVLLELQKYITGSKQNYLIIQSSLPEKNVLLIQTQYTADAQELQSLLEETNVLKSKNNNKSNFI